jgi:hypothetical protein
MTVIKSNDNKNGFGHHPMVGTESILFAIQRLQLNLVAINGSPSNGAK